MSKTTFLGQRGAGSMRNAEKGEVGDGGYATSHFQRGNNRSKCFCAERDKKHLCIYIVETMVGDGLQWSHFIED